MSNKNSDCPARKCFRCGSEDHLIAKCPKPPKDNEKRRKSDKSKEKGNSAKYNSDNEDDLKVYASMARMSNDDVRENKDYGNSAVRKHDFMVKVWKVQRKMPKRTPKERKLLWN